MVEAVPGLQLQPVHYEQRGSTTVHSLLSKHTPMDFSLIQGLNCLHVAAKNGNLECLRHLLNNCSIGVDDPAIPSGCTALHFSLASTSGLRSLQCMKLLLERGADQNKCV